MVPETSDCGWELFGEGVHAADDLLADLCGVRIVKALNPLKPQDYERIVRKIAGELKNKVKPIEAAAVKAAVNGLDVDWKNLSAEARSKIIEAAQKHLGAPVASAALPSINVTLSAYAKDIVSSTKSKTVLTHDLAISANMNATDERIATYAQVSQGHFVRNQFGERSAIFGAQARDIVSSGLDQGFGSAEIADRLRAKLGPSTGQSDGYWDMIAMVFANRARTMTQLASFNEAGISDYAWESVLDEATSMQCRFLHGRKFPVVAAMKSFQAVEDAADPEEIKTLQPFMQFGKMGGQPSLYLGSGDARTLVAHVTENVVGQKDKIGNFANAMETDALAKAGVRAPPIHGRCRSTIIPEFGASAGTYATPPQPSAAVPKPSAAEMKATALASIKEHGTGATTPTSVGFSTPFDSDPAFIAHPAFTTDGKNAQSLQQMWEANTVSKKPNLDALIPTNPVLNQPLIESLVKKPKLIDTMPTPKVVKYKNQLYVVDGHEALAAQKMLGQKVAYTDYVDLDKPIKVSTAPLTEPVASPPPAHPTAADPHVPHPPMGAPALSSMPPPPEGSIPAHLPPPGSLATKETAKAKLESIPASAGHFEASSLMAWSGSPPFAGKISAIDALFNGATTIKTVNPDAVIATTTSAFSKGKVAMLLNDEEALAAALKKVKIVEVDGKLYVFGGHDAVFASKLLGKEGIETQFVDGSAIVNTPAPKPAPYVPTPHPAAPVLPHSILAHLEEKDPPPPQMPPPQGKTVTQYKEIASRAISKASTTSQRAIREFTGSDYSDIRKTEHMKEEDARKELGSSYARSKEQSEQIHEAFGVVEPMPGTVYRGLSRLSDESLKKFATDDIVEMRAVSSASRTPEVAYRPSFGNLYGSGNRVIMIIKQRSGIPIETISGAPSEDEILMNRHARFKVTKRSRATGKSNVLLIECEEIHGEK